ncbi:PilW family protein [Halopseudomonas sp.]|uniref:PilW family protein n=1 Tax=Halopseudomonas sp. TaxID=2901191 RepID=UPI0035667266
MSGDQTKMHAYQQRGLSLVELMIALALGLIISAAIMQVFLSSKNVYRMQESMARIQENGRFAVDYLSRDLRMAGYMGCGNLDRVEVSVIAEPPANFMNFNADTFLVGLNNVTAGNVYGAKAGTDVVSTRRASGESIRLTGNLAPINANIQIVDNRFGFAQDDTLMISDCVAADIFNVVNKPRQDDGKKVTITHSQGSNSNNNLSKLYGSDAEVMAFKSITYYIKPSENNAALDALWMQIQGGPTSVVDVELVDGVEDLQLQYGIDTSGNRNVNEYRTADAVTDWSRVVSVQFSMLLAGSDSVIDSSGDFSQALKFNGETITSDGVMRNVFESVVAVRNRAP